MPAWAQWLIGAAAVVTALGVLITKIVRPGVKAAATAEEMLPLLRSLTVTFRDAPDAFKVLYAMAGQFRSDSGSTLRDVVNRLEVAALDAKSIAEQLRVEVAADRQLDNRDRQELRELVLTLDRLTVRVEALAESGVRIEADRATVAQELRERIDVVDKATAGVAADLIASHERADAVPTGEHGKAADAASRSPSPDEEPQQ